MIKNVIFDMDGLLINSEPLWAEAEIKVYGKLGIDLEPAFFIPVQGFRIDEAVQYVYDKHPWAQYSIAQVVEMIIDEVQHLISTQGTAMEGVAYLLEFFKQRGFKIALASSSFMRLIDATLLRLNIRDYFDVIHSAESEIFGKPHPAIYLSTLESLNCHANEAIVFEDSFNGMIAAKAAKIKTVAVPLLEQQGNSRFGFADLQLKSLAEFADSHLVYLDR